MVEQWTSPHSWYTDEPFLSYCNRAAYQQMLRQATMLSYKNAFGLLSAAILCLTPLPFLMRLPSGAKEAVPEEFDAH